MSRGRTGAARQAADWSLGGGLGTVIATAGATSSQTK